MKKTLVTILVLGSVAVADTIHISNGQLQDPESGELVKKVHAVESSVSFITLGELSSSCTVAPDSVTTSFVESQLTNSIATANTNVGNGGSWTYTLNFQIISIANNNTVASIDIDLFAHSVGDATTPAQLQNNAKTINVAYTLANAAGSSIVENNGSITTSAISSKPSTLSAYAADGITRQYGDKGYALLTLNDLNLVTGDYTLTIEMSQSVKSGTFVGVGNVALNVVPEPSTATLSLLAMAGLAARRRRASR